ncbi:MAG: hypothetical protein HY867_10995 [Chloroflexi bacterium]|nr:hypothetical protein [Chloroflexota bacterium]
MIIKPSRMDVFLSTRGLWIGYILAVSIFLLIDKKPHYESFIGLFLGATIVEILVMTVLFNQTQEWATFVITENSIEGPSGAMIINKRVKLNFAQNMKVIDRYPGWLVIPKIICGNQQITIPSFINKRDCEQILKLVKERISCADVSP